MKKLVTVFSMLLFTHLSFSQIEMGGWKMFPSPFEAMDVVSGNGLVYGMLTMGIVEYDLEAGEKTLWTAANYLSDVFPTAIAYNSTLKTLVVGYRDGNIDLIKNNSVFNVPALLDANINGNKKINRIEVKGDLAYLSTGVGIVVLDVKNKEIKDTYNPSLNNEEYIDLTFVQDSVFVLTKDKIYAALAENSFLTDPSQWKTELYLPDTLVNAKYTSIESFNNQLFLAQKSINVADSDTVFRIQNGLRSVWKTNIDIKNLETDGNNLLLCIQGNVEMYDNSLNKIGSIFKYQDGNLIYPNGACRYKGYYFVADNNSGLVKSSSSWNSERINFSGPRYNDVFNVNWAKGKLAIACGGMDAHLPTFNKSGGATFQGQTWGNTSVYGDPMLNNAPVWDFLSSAVNPKQTSVVAYGTNSGVPLVITNNGKVTDTFGFTNSLLEANSADWARISDLCYDDDGNLWVLNSNASRPLKVLTKEGIWYDFDLGNAVNGKNTGRLLIDQNGVKWICVDGLGLVAFDNGKTIADMSDDKYKIFTTVVNNGNLPSNTVQAIAADVDNNIWIGTSEGMRVLFNNNNITEASPGQYDFQKLLIQYGANVEIVLGYTDITSIEVDGGNRKWIGTSSAGVFLLAPDGLSVKRTFTEVNSPLLSNSIIDMTIDRNTGIVYFATAKGLIAYRSDASQGDQDYKNVIVFPNPVRPNYYGPITIQGIAYNSDVRITDVSGRLVFHTKSNGGTATWNGQTLSGERAKTGVYLIWTSIDDHDYKGRKVGKVVFIN